GGRVDQVRRPMIAPYTGPLPVIESYDKYFKIQLPSGDTDNISVNRLKPGKLPEVPC
ncbi:hypothetical protein SK128_023182, partial [Halocaridina rubra]